MSAFTGMFGALGARFGAFVFGAAAAGEIVTARLAKRTWLAERRGAQWAPERRGTTWVPRRKGGQWVRDG